MVLKSLGQLEQHAFFVLFTAFILVLFWHATWGIVDRVEHYVVDELHVKKLVFNVATLMFVVFLIGLFPRMLLKF
jgi:succinate dehydrogenase hydrophobic anchor subunit